jgi:hypothetical protein
LLNRNGKSPFKTDAKLLSLHGCDGTLLVRQLKQVWPLLVDLNDEIAEPDQHQPENAHGHLRHDTGHD